MLQYLHTYECSLGPFAAKTPTRNINYGSMTVAGTIYLNPRQYVSLYVFSSTDNNYQVQSESGWGCHFMNSRIGFHANAAGNEHFSKGWGRVASWQANPSKNKALYSLGGSPAKNGYYHAPAAGYYACNVQLRLDSAEKQSYFQLVLALNGDRSWKGGTHLYHCDTPYLFRLRLEYFGE